MSYGQPLGDVRNAFAILPPVNAKLSLYGMSRHEVAELIASLDMPKYRADQLWHWLYSRLASSFDEMTSLSASDRDRLAEVATLGETTLAALTPSSDDTARKSLHRMKDGRTVESVVMHYADPADDPSVERNDTSGDRHTLCLSTQAGCAMGCVFCATGQMGLERDLSRAECVEQVVLAARSLKDSGARLTNVVFMGMGEPLANWSATWGTVETLTHPDGFGMSPRRLTISTVGIVPGIRRLAASGLPIRLAVSLHAPDDDLRSRLVAVNRTYPLDAILEACREYQREGGRRITFEYVLIDGVNDRPDQASALAGLLNDFNAHVNLIPLNPTAGSPMRPSTPESARLFAQTLRRAGLPATLRMRRGIKIDAGCGQLRARHVDGRIGRSIPLSVVSPGKTAALESRS